MIFLNKTITIHMRRKILILFCFAICTLNLLSQRNSKALDIGDLAPNLKSKNVLFYGSPSIELKQFQGKLIILDFFQTTCLSCVHKLPAYMSLQQKFKDEIQIILVTPEDAKRVSSFWEKKLLAISIQKMALLEDVRLPIVTGDSQWVKYFPHEVISHEAWIGPDQRVIAFTGSEYVKEEYIQEALDAKVLNWQMKRDYSYNTSQPTLAYNPQQPEVIKPSQMFYSSLWRTSELVQGGIFKFKDSINKTFKLSIFKSSALQLYKFALGWTIRTDIMNRIIWETKRREEIDPSASNLLGAEWDRRYNLSFEAVFPGSPAFKTISGALLNSLNTYFGINGRLETRKVDCWLLVAKPGYSHQKLTQKEVRSLSSQYDHHDSLMLVKPSYTVHTMNSVIQGFPVIDSTRIDGYVFMGKIARKDLGDLGKVKEHLSRNGFDLVKGREPIEMLVLSDEDAK